MHLITARDVYNDLCIAGNTGGCSRISLVVVLPILFLAFFNRHSINRFISAEKTPWLFFTFPIIFISPQTVGLNICFFPFPIDISIKLALDNIFYCQLNYDMYIGDIGKMSPIELAIRSTFILN